MKLTITIEYKGIKLDCYVNVTVTRDPLGTGDSPTEYDVDYDYINLHDDDIDIYALLENDIDKISDLVIEKYKEDWQ